MGCAWFYNLLKIRCSVQVLEILAVFLYTLSLLRFFLEILCLCLHRLPCPAHTYHTLQKKLVLVRGYKVVFSRKATE